MGASQDADEAAPPPSEGSLLSRRVQVWYDVMADCPHSSTLNCMVRCTPLRGALLRRRVQVIGGYVHYWKVMCGLFPCCFAFVEPAHSG